MPIFHIRRLSAIALVLSALNQGLGSAQQPSPLLQTGQSWSAAEPVDTLIQSMLEQHDAVGAAVAIARDGRLVYARGFGFADRESESPIEPDSLFRIASISKPITAIAILKLVEQGRLSLDDKVLDIVDFEITDRDRFDSRWNQVTIRHLLTHSGGWDRQVSFDPMFQSVLISAALGSRVPASATDVIRFMLTQPLDFDPGQKYAYSNFGYNLLGRVIEATVEQEYETHVREAILKPLGISGMRIGSSTETAPGEVRYHDSRGQAGLAIVGQPLGRRVHVPYGTWYHESLDAHGGWIASAVDLVRIGSALNRSCDSILTPQTIQTMLAPPEGTLGHTASGTTKSRYYALGWTVNLDGDKRSRRYSHNGSLPGTSTILSCSQDSRIVWSVLFNSRTDRKGGELAPLIQPKMEAAIKQISEWPEFDHFKVFCPVPAKPGN